MTLADQTWVLTGAAGVVASSLRGHVADEVGRLRLLDVVPVVPQRANEDAVLVDLRDQDAVESAFQGADGVIHLGGIADEADFHDLAEVNIVGTYHVLESARRVNARRVVCASSNRLTGFYAQDTQVEVSMPPRPDGLYGVSKVAGEALARLYVDKFGMQVASIRIGSFELAPQDERQLSTWLSPADCWRAFRAAMTSTDLTYAVFYGVSRNTRRWWDLAAGQRVGFEPQDDAEGHADSVQEDAGPARRSVPQGEKYVTPQYTLSRMR
ncbi:MAG: NAD-dependent epimerase/dehydratase family protein [Solirubrobacteraceae bacterium]